MCKWEKIPLTRRREKRELWYVGAVEICVAQYDSRFSEEAHLVCLGKRGKNCKREYTMCTYETTFDKTQTLKNIDMRRDVKDTSRLCKLDQNTCAMRCV